MNQLNLTIDDINDLENALAIVRCLYRAIQDYEISVPIPLTYDVARLDDIPTLMIKLNYMMRLASEGRSEGES